MCYHSFALRRQKSPRRYLLIISNVEPLFVGEISCFSRVSSFCIVGNEANGNAESEQTSSADNHFANFSNRDEVLSRTSGSEIPPALWVMPNADMAHISIASSSLLYLENAIHSIMEMFVYFFNRFPLLAKYLYANLDNSRRASVFSEDHIAVVAALDWFVMVSNKILYGFFPLFALLTVINELNTFSKWLNSCLDAKCMLPSLRADLVSLKNT